MGPGGLPLYQQILKTMRDRLRRARYASGLLPTETELVREFRSCEDGPHAFLLVKEYCSLPPYVPSKDREALRVAATVRERRR